MDNLTQLNGSATTAMAPSRLQQFIGAVQQAFERFRAQTVVMSQNEVHPRIRLKPWGASSHAS